MIWECMWYDVLRSVRRSADRQEFFVPRTKCWQVNSRLVTWRSPTADRVQKIKGFHPLVELRWEEKRSGEENRNGANRDKNVKAALYSLSILKKHRDWFSEA